MGNKSKQPECESRSARYGVDVADEVASGTIKATSNKSNKKWLFSESMTLDMMAVFESLLITISAYASAFIYTGLFLGNTVSIVKTTSIGALCALVTHILLKKNGCYSIDAIRSLNHSAGPVILSVLSGFATLIFMGFALKIANTYSRAWVAIWLALSVTGILFVRAIMQYWLVDAIAKGAFHSTAVVIGTGERANKFLDYVHKQAPQLNIIGLVNFDEKIIGNSINGMPVWTLAEMITRGKAGEYDKIILAAEDYDPSQLKGLLSQLRVLPLDVLAYANETLHIGKTSNIEFFNDLTMIKVSSRPLSEWKVFSKIVLDYSVALVAIIFAIIPMLVIMLLLKLSNPRLPVFFRQRRHGFNHGVFEVIKFRTMNVMEDGQHIVQASKADQRITAIGRLLRKSSLDELPQIFNVLRGEMSIVGPRPHALSHNMEYEKKILEYATRNRVKPGMTGWAQIHGFRGETRELEQMQQRINYDLYYIENWSIWLDIKIILLTPIHLIMGSGAH